MSCCHDVSGDGFQVVDLNKENTPSMKKILSTMLGLSLVLGAATLTFAADDKEGKDKAKAKDSKDKKKKKKSTDKTEKKS